MDVRISTFNVIAMFNAFFFFSCLHLVYTTELNQTVLVNSSVLLNCDGLLSESRKWKFNMSYVLFYNNAPMSTRFKDTATLTKNYSLSIKPVEISHEGFYECIYGTHVTKHYLRVEGLYIIRYFTLVSSECWCQVSAHSIGHGHGHKYL